MGSRIPNAGIKLTPNSSHLAEASRGQELHPELLNHDEQLIWKVVWDSGLILQAAKWDRDRWTYDWEKLEREIFPQLRDHWETFRKVASGELPRTKMPKWKKPEPASSSDDLPF